MTNVMAINVVPVFEEVCAGHSLVTKQMRVLTTIQIQDAHIVTIAISDILNWRANSDTLRLMGSPVRSRGN